MLHTKNLAKFIFNIEIRFNLWHLLILMTLLLAFTQSAFSNDIVTNNVSTQQNNQPPIANDDNDLETFVNQPIESIPVLSNDSGNQLKVSAITQRPKHGFVKINQDGTILYLPNVNYKGLDGFEYQIKDANGATATANVVFEIINRDPVAADCTVKVKKLQTVIIVVSDKSKDPDGQKIKVVSTTSPAHGKAEIRKDFPDTIFYTAGDSLDTVTFNYKIEDESGGQSTGTITVMIEDLPKTLTAVDDTKNDSGKEIEVIEGEKVTVFVLNNDDLGISDFPIDPQAVKIHIVEQPTYGIAIVNDQNEDEAASVTYSASDDFPLGDKDEDTVTFQYFLRRHRLNNGKLVDPPLAESNIATVTIKVKRGRPKAKDDTVFISEIKETTISTSVVLENDEDPQNHSKKVNFVNFPSKGKARLDEEGKKIIYTPGEDFVNEDKFEYTIEDEKGLEDTATITIKLKKEPKVAVRFGNNSAIEDFEARAGSTQTVGQLALGNGGIIKSISLEHLGNINQVKSVNFAVDVNGDGELNNNEQSFFVGAYDSLNKKTFELALQLSSENELEPSANPEANILIIYELSSTLFTLDFNNPRTWGALALLFPLGIFVGFYRKRKILGNLIIISTIFLLASCSSSSKQPIQSKSTHQVHVIGLEVLDKVGGEPLEVEGLPLSSPVMTVVN